MSGCSASTRASASTPSTTSSQPRRHRSRAEATETGEKSDHVLPAVALCDQFLSGTNGTCHVLPHVDNFLSVASSGFHHELEEL